MKIIYCFIYGKYRKFKKPKISYIFEKTLFFLSMTVNAKWRWKKFKEEESIEILGILGLIKNI